MGNMNHLLLTIISTVLINITGISQETKATFFSHNLGKFYLYVNNQLVNRSPQNQVDYTSFGPQKLMLKIVFQDHNLKPTLSEVKLKSNKVLVYVVYLNKEKITIDKFEKVKIGNYKPGFVNLSQYAMPEYKARLGCDYPCTIEIVNITVRQMNTESNSIAQMTIATSLIKNNCITVADLSLVLSSFSYETDKVEFAKYAWPYIYDQENYTSLNSVFEYPQTMAEIDKFVHLNQ